MTPINLFRTDDYDTAPYIATLVVVMHLSARFRLRYRFAVESQRANPPITFRQVAILFSPIRAEYCGR
jgi:hypothetical protein